MHFKSQTALTLCVVYALHANVLGSTLYDNSEAGRRRRRRSSNDVEKDKTESLVKGLMEEVFILRKELRDSHKQTEAELKKLKSAIGRGGGEGGEGAMLPFKVDPELRTVTLTNWNLHVESDGSPGGNLIVGRGHDYSKARNSFFSGTNHSGAGEANAFLGGEGNKASGEGVAMAGGKDNRGWGDRAFIGGGALNVCAESSRACTVVGGSENIVGTKVSYAFVGGGHHNRLTSGIQHRGYKAEHSAIVGGYNNTVERSLYAMISGGEHHNIGSTARAAIFGGAVNKIEYATASTIIGGLRNKMTHDLYSLISGGNLNKISGSHNLITGGAENKLDSGAYKSCIFGGNLNRIWNSVSGGTVIGGLKNRMYNSGQYTSIVGGRDNEIRGPNVASSIVGGTQNKINSKGGAPDSNILGGNANQVLESLRSSIIGGDANIVNGSYSSAIVGGTSNLVMANKRAVIVGGKHNNIAANSDSGSQETGYVGFIGGGEFNNVTTSFSAIAGGHHNYANKAYTFIGAQNGYKKQDGVQSQSNAQIVDDTMRTESVLKEREAEAWRAVQQAESEVEKIKGRAKQESEADEAVNNAAESSGP